MVNYIRFITDDVLNNKRPDVDNILGQIRDYEKSKIKRPVSTLTHKRKLPTLEMERNKRKSLNRA